MQDKDPLSGFK